VLLNPVPSPAPQPTVLPPAPVTLLLKPFSAERDGDLPSWLCFSVGHRVLKPQPPCPFVLCHPPRDFFFFPSPAVISPSSSVSPSPQQTRYFFLSLSPRFLVSRDFWVCCSVAFLLSSFPLCWHDRSLFPVFLEEDPIFFVGGFDPPPGSPGHPASDSLLPTLSRLLTFSGMSRSPVLFRVHRNASVGILMILFFRGCAC